MVLLYFASVDREAYLLRVSLESESRDIAMFATQSGCDEGLQKQARDYRKGFDEARAHRMREHKPPREYPKYIFQCIPESEPTVAEQWRGSARAIGLWRGQNVYYYRAADPQTLTGAYVLATRKAERYDSDLEVSMIYVDQRTCDESLAAAKKEYSEALALQREAQHDAKLMDDLPSFDEMLKQDELDAEGACIPIENAIHLVRKYCEGLPLKLGDGGFGGTYNCDRQILSPFRND